ncbi:hypothetical protein FE257_007922 [Aspergillus nanangensis]|uniref:Zn(2)-C6 fungal-type domain-containing protein n=1 Tax=Aspergillus nanangensis TaxID=2582783 RepID=A0AAD4GY14_ASPNN|nr:hypothetical protein FE257_007922 [Aspergillus nanangensis]
MLRQPGTRSRSGCLECKGRKRRCGEEQPACRGCVARGLECSYIYNRHQAQFRFRISKGADPGIPVQKRPHWHFIAFSMQDVETLAQRYQLPQESQSSQDEPSCLERTLAWLPIVEPDISLPLWPFDHHTELESQLYQYYLSVLCHARVFQDNERNRYRRLVAPHCQTRGPLWHAVISLSANDRQTKQSHSSVVNYGRLALTHKLTSLELLRQSVGDSSAANENIMACLLLCSLEIASGNRPDWIQHAEGGSTILSTFPEVIDPEIWSFAYYYFHLRRTFLRTTEYGQTEYPPSSTPDALLLLPPPPSTHPRSTTEIQAHMGCSPGLLDLIAEITELTVLKREWRLASASSLESEEWMLDRATSIRSRLQPLQQTVPEAGSTHLQLSAECFHVAADLLLRLACDMPLSQPSLRDTLRALLGLLGRVIHDALERQLFPMWPLFVAGCLSIDDSDRQRVLGYFAILERAWPVSNIPSALEAIQTVWKSRDLNPGVGDAFDWQCVIAKMGWKLALT